MLMIGQSPSTGGVSSLLGRQNHDEGGNRAILIGYWVLGGGRAKRRSRWLKEFHTWERSGWHFWRSVCAYWMK